MNKFSLKMVLGLVLLGMTASLAIGGDLTPPTDAFDGSNNPKSSQKSISEIEPRNVILGLPYPVTNSGSYYLGKNMNGSSNNVGIVISCSDVEIDLNGFALIGTGGSLDGIRVLGTNENITIRNGSIRQWGKFGINAPHAHDGAVEGIKANRNGLGGIAFGNGAMIERCSVFGNGYKAPLPPTFVPPSIVDEDYDGMEDSYEWDIINADPNDWISNLVDVSPWMDYDYDGTSNMDEIMAGTDPTVNDLADSDYDGMDDDWEMQIVSNYPAYSNIYEVMQWHDPDGDYVNNINEFWSDTNPCDSNSVDWDQDGMLDSWEMVIVNADTNDFIYDIWGVQAHHDFDGDLASNWDEYEADTSPTNILDVPEYTGSQGDYASYTNPPTGPMFDEFIDPSDEITDDGIRAGGYSTIRECKARGNRGTGISVQYGSRIVASISAGNCTDGIQATDYCTVLENTVTKNKRDGIIMGSKNRVQNNNCGQNGDFEMLNQTMPMGAGIRIMGNGNRIEDNNVCGNAMGIQVDNSYSIDYGTAGMSGGRNLIIKNSAVDNWGMAFSLSGGDYMGGTMYSDSVNDAMNTNTAAMMDPNSPFSNFNF